METEFLKELEKMNKEDISFDSHVAEKFILIYNSKFSEDGKSFYEEQSNLFSSAVKSSEYLKKCSAFSLYNAFISLAINGLSLEKNSTTQCYLEPRAQKIGKDEKGKDIYEEQAVLKISGYGELLIRKRAGQIKDINNPVVIYECDSFSYGEREGKIFVNYTKTFPRKSSKIIAGYVKITRPDNSIDYKVMDMEDILRLKSYSEKNNKKWDKDNRVWIKGTPNPLYGNSEDGSDIDSGFFMAKLIKHAFKTYPRITVGDGAVMQSDEDENTVVEEVRTDTFGPEQKAAEPVNIIDDDSTF